MKSYFTEIISQSEFKREFGGKVREVQKSEKYRSRLKTMLKRFFTEPGDRIAKRAVVVPFGTVKPKGLTEQDKRIIRYLNDHGYLATPESYEIGLATTPKGKQVAITKITSLPEGLDVGGDLDLRDTKITSLPEGIEVRGDLYLNRTEITSLPDDLSVGGRIYKDF